MTAWLKLFFTLLALSISTVWTDDFQTRQDPAPNESYNCECGKAKTLTGPSRIVGGQDDQLYTYSWFAALTELGSLHPFCGASLVTDLHSITTRKCVENRDFLLRFGLQDHLSASSITSRRPTHIEVNNQTDIAIIEFSPPLNFDDGCLSASPVCMPNASQEFANVTFEAVGWNLEQSDASDESEAFSLQTRTLNYQSITCNQTSKKYLCNSGHLRAQYSGGALLVSRGENKHYLAGVMSSIQVQDSLINDTTILFEKVQAVLDWIDAVTSRGKKCVA